MVAYTLQRQTIVIIIIYLVTTTYFPLFFESFQHAATCVIGNRHFQDYINYTLSFIYMYVCPLLVQIEAVIVNPSQREAMDTHVDQLLRAVLMQMRMNFSTPLTEASTPETLQKVCQLQTVV